MTIGILATRYARALYSFAAEKGEEDKVYTEMKNIYHQLLSVPELQRAVSKPILSDEQKAELLEIAAGSDVSASAKHFIRFVLKKEEDENLRYMTSAYQTVYRKAKNIIHARYISAREADAETLERIRSLIAKDYGESTNIELETEVRPSLVGGFILQVEDREADASVAGQLKRMRKALT